jgi:hypothetical protein
MNRITPIAARAAAVILAAGLACIAGIALGGGGATGTGFMARGPITAFGSIFVNGVEFFTDHAQITVNGVSNKTQADLAIGMVLTVNGSVDNNGRTGNANTVEYHADVIGAVDRAADANGTFGALGQDVATDANTVFSNLIGVADLQPGDYVEVSGYPTPSGLLAARVERKSGPTIAVQAQGTNANTTDTTFTIEDLVVDYSGASLQNLPPGGRLLDGLTVLAIGPAPVNGVLQAASVAVIDTSVTGSGNSNGSLSGVIASVASGVINVNGQSIALAANTQYVNGTAADVAPGKLVKVDYTTVGNSVIASKVEFTVLDPSVQVLADVTANNGSSLELLGPAGIIVTTNANTQFRDNSGGSGKGRPPLTLATINVGDHLQVAGAQSSADGVLAARIVRVAPTATINIEGRAQSTQAPVFTVLGEAVTVTDATDLRDENGNAMTAQDFFARAAGHDVTVTAQTVGGSIVATQVLLDQ